MKLLFPQSTSSIGLTLLISSLFASAYNLRFWRGFLDATGSLSWSHLPLHLGALAVIVLLINACLTLISFRLVFKPLLVLLFLVSALASYFVNIYGIQIDRSMIPNLLQTDLREATELLNWKLFAFVAGLGLAPSLLLWRMEITLPSGGRGLLIRGGVAGASVLLALALLLIFYKSLAPALREHRELRYLLTPTNVIQAVHGFLKVSKTRTAVVPQLGTDAVKGAGWSGNHHRSVIVLVVGETARAANFSLNGYARLTNPELAAQSGLINFTHVESCGTATAVSLPCMFSALGRKNYSDEKASSQQGLLNVLAHAGFDVHWRDNNSGCKGTCSGVEFEDLSDPAKGGRWCVKGECYDERLLDGLADMLASAKDDLVIVLHQKGSHGPEYSHRYPAGFGKFGPVCTTNDLGDCSREEITAAYDNTILYTDHFLSRTIDILRHSEQEQGLNTAMVYVSDHGESLGERNMYLHGAPYIIAPDEQRHVPMMMWLSDGFAARFQIDRRCIQARSGQAFSHDNLFHSVLGMLDVNTAVYNPGLDIFSPCTTHG